MSEAEKNYQSLMSIAVIKFEHDDFLEAVYYLGKASGVAEQMANRQPPGDWKKKWTRNWFWAIRCKQFVREAVQWHNMI